MQKLLMANWKMNGAQGQAATLFGALAQLDAADVKLVVMPPAPYLAMAQTMLHNTEISWGAQTFRAEPQGAYTGDISASMLLDFDCQYVLVGHSERRQYWAETNAQIAAQAVAACSAGLVPVICVGETLTVRQADQHLAVLTHQISEICKVLLAEFTEKLPRCIWAYEPIWAIGTGQSATPVQVAEVHDKIHEVLLHTSLEFSNQCRIIYGGSVNARNICDLMSQNHVDGALVGGASLDIEQFSKMVDLCKV